MHHIYWAQCVLEPKNCYWSPILQSPCAATGKATAMRSLLTAAREKPTQLQRPSRVKKTKITVQKNWWKWLAGDILSAYLHFIYICACVHVCMLTRFSHVQLFVTLWTVAHQALLSMEFLRQEYCRRLPSLPPGGSSQPRDWNSSVYEILQARIPEWVAMPSSRGSFWPKDRTCLFWNSCTAGGFFTAERPGKPTYVPIIV